MDPIHPIVPQPVPLPPVAPSPRVAGVTRDGGRANAERERRRRAARQGIAPDRPDGAAPDDDDDAPRPRIDITA